LDYKKVKPFRIKKSIKNINFKLDLPKTIKIHPVFHALLLKPANNRTPITKIPKKIYKKVSHIRH